MATTVTANSQCGTRIRSPSLRLRTSIAVPPWVGPLCLFLPVPEAPSRARRRPPGQPRPSTVPIADDLSGEFLGCQPGLFLRGPQGNEHDHGDRKTPCSRRAPLLNPDPPPEAEDRGPL